MIIIIALILIIIFAFVINLIFNVVSNKPIKIIDSFQLVQQELSKENRSYNYTEDWVDLVFSITEKHISNKGNSWIKAEGVLNGKQVGFIVEINDKTSKFILDKDNKPDYKFAPVSDGIVLKNIGISSNNLATELSQLFENSNTPKDMTDSVSFTSIALEGDGSQIALKPVKFKLFFDRKFENPNSSEANKFYENDYFEYYINASSTSKCTTHCF